MFEKITLAQENNCPIEPAMRGPSRQTLKKKYRMHETQEQY